MAASKRKPVRVKIVVKDIDRGYRDMMRRIEQARNTAIAVGITAGSGGEAHRDSDGMTVLDIGTIHEFGLGVPERSFIRGWFDAYQQTARKQIAAVMKAVLSGKYGKAQALELLGVRFVGECQKYMVTAPFQPLSPVTIARKGSSKPLIDTGQLRSSITFRVEADGKASGDRTETVPVQQKKKPVSLKKRLQNAKKAAERAANKASKTANKLAKQGTKARKGVRMGKKATRGFRKFFRAGSGRRRR